MNMNEKFFWIVEFYYAIQFIDSKLKIALSAAGFIHVIVSNGQINVGITGFQENSREMEMTQGRSL
jgi:hypothetical protein